MRNLTLASLLVAAACQSSSRDHELKIQAVKPGQVGNVNTEGIQSPVFQSGTYEGGNGVFVFDKSQPNKLFFYNGGTEADLITIVKGQPAFYQENDQAYHTPFIKMDVASIDPQRVGVAEMDPLTLVASFLWWGEEYRFFVFNGSLFVIYEGRTHRIDLFNPTSLQKKPPKFSTVYVYEARDFTAFEPTGYFGDPTLPSLEEKEGLIIFSAKTAPQQGDTPHESPWVIKLQELRACLANL